MSTFLTLSLLLSFISISYGQTSVDPTTEPTFYPTFSPTIYSCDKSKCQTYYSNNSTWLLPSNNGCKDEVDGVAICVDCPNANFECECVSEKTDIGCLIGEALADALQTWIIILIVIGSVCGLCIIGSIVYCVCAGALCCAAMNK